MGYRKVEFNYAGNQYMPINLKWLLQRYGVSQSKWCAAVQQMDGSPLSLSAASQLLNYDVWPKLTPKHSIKTQTEQLLKRAGASAADIAIAWHIDQGDRGRDQHPAGAHEGQQKRRIANNHNQPIDINFTEPEMLSPEAKKLFNLPANPFHGDPENEGEFFMSPDVQRVITAINYAVKHPTILAVVGESGSGKSTLFNYARDRLLKEHSGLRLIVPACIDKKTLTAEAIVDSIILDLDKYAKIPRTREARTRMARKLLMDSSANGAKHLLMIEEAHDLSMATLKQLKRFFEIGEGMKRVLSILLIGQPELKEKLNVRANYDAREFINRCEIDVLHPLDKHLEKYCEVRMARLSLPLTAVFDKDAFDAIRVRLTSKQAGVNLSQVYPLIVNGLVTKAMNACAEIGVPRVNAAIVKDL